MPTADEANTVIIPIQKVTIGEHQKVSGAMLLLIEGSRGDRFLFGTTPENLSQIGEMLVDAAEVAIAVNLGEAE